MPTATTWTVGPCPNGWRLPTKEECESLLDATKVTTVWTTVNGVNGRRFLDLHNGNDLFLPAAGYRNSDINGPLYSVGINGRYWSSTDDTAVTDVFRLGFADSFTISVASFPKNIGYSIRCVK
jgi:uncharacterized protein (TIGR02145 family)